MEDVIGVEGTVQKRPEQMARDDIATGRGRDCGRHSRHPQRVDVPPFTITDEVKAHEDLRLKYRYLDLRRNPMQKNIELRHRIIFAMRHFLNSQGFLEIETPMLVRCTPEGARDYLVPSRVHPGKFYALPQSPHVVQADFSWCLVSIATFNLRDACATKICAPTVSRSTRKSTWRWRSFAKRNVFSLVEQLMTEVVKVARDEELVTPSESFLTTKRWERYGSDKPDLRFGMELTTLDDAFAGTDFRIMKQAFERGETVRGFVVKEALPSTRRPSMISKRWPSPTVPVG